MYLILVSVGLLVIGEEMYLWIIGVSDYVVEVIVLVICVFVIDNEFEFVFVLCMIIKSIFFVV